MRLNHNMASLNVYRSYSKALNRQSTEVERISTGSKVNSAKDNPNVLAQSERMRMQIRGMQMANRNVQDGVSMLQNAEGGMESIGSMLSRMRELTVQAGSGSNDPQDKQAIQGEINELLNGIDNVANYNEFNGVKLLASDNMDNNNPTELKMQTGANREEQINIPKFNLTSKNLTNSDGTKTLRDIDVTSATGIDEALNILDNAMSTVTSIRSQYGALENRFESTMDRTNEIGDKVQGCESSIRDADLAEEVMNYSKESILAQAGNAMMVQANQLPQDALKVLENVRAK